MSTSQAQKVLSTIETFDGGHIINYADGWSARYHPSTGMYTFYHRGGYSLLSGVDYEKQMENERERIKNLDKTYKK